MKTSTNNSKKESLKALLRGDKETFIAQNSPPLDYVWDLDRIWKKQTAEGLTELSESELKEFNRLYKLGLIKFEGEEEYV